MRLPKYLSPSALKKFETDEDAFYIQYLAGTRIEREEQQRPASVGSAFDARVKSSLFADVFGRTDEKNNYEYLFEQQVEPQNRDWAGPAGEHVFQSYKDSGAYADLLKLLLKASVPPRFEFSVEAQLEGVPFLGKPDLGFTTEASIHVVHDWKVNGYCGKSTTSPHKGYALCRDGYKTVKPSKSHGQEHAAYLGMKFGDLTINTSYLEASDEDWADQLTLYGWALGETPGDENVVNSIHQIVAKPGTPPQLRVAEFRARVSKVYQLNLMARMKKCWHAITSGHVFQHMTLEESQARCDFLEQQAVGLKGDGSDLEAFFRQATAAPYRG